MFCLCEFIYSELLFVVQSPSHVGLFVTWTVAFQASLSFTISRSLPKFIPIESVKPSNHLVLCSPLLLLPSIFPRIEIFSDEPALRITWPKYWSFSFSISPSSEYSLGLFLLWVTGLISLQSKGLSKVFSNTTVQKHHFFFFFGIQLSSMVQLSHLYMTTGKAIALTIWTFVGKVLSLLFNMPSRFVIASLPRSKRLLISWLQLLFTVVLEP